MSQVTHAGFGQDGGAVQLVQYRDQTIGFLSRDWVSAQSMVLPTEWVGSKSLPAGVKALVACGEAVSAPEFANPGDYVLVTDHVNASGYNPLIGCLGCFPDMSGAYPARFRETAFRVATSRGKTVREGVLVACPDPMEPPAWLEALNGSVIGTSMPALTLVAAKDSVPTLGVMLVTNRGHRLLSSPNPDRMDTRCVREFVQFALECAASISEQLN